MNVREFYETIGGDYDEMLAGLGKEERIIRYLFKFPSKDMPSNIAKLLKNKDYEAAFCESHNLKGMSINIGFDKLYELSSSLTETLRNDPENDAVEEILLEVTREYQSVCRLIKQIKV